MRNVVTVVPVVSIEIANPLILKNETTETTEK